MIALLLLRIALVVTPLAFAGEGFGPEQFILPKEVVVCALVITALAFALWRTPELAFDRIDAALAVFVVWSAASYLVAVNGNLAARSIGLAFVAGAAFLTARILTRQGHGMALLHAGAIGVSCLAVTAYLEAQGVIDLALPGRGPAGTAGNRNYTAHLIVLGLPLVAAAAMNGRTRVRRLCWACALALLVGVAVLTRSRGAWIAVGVVGVGAVWCLRYRRSWPRARLVGLACAAGLVLGLVVPTRTTWQTENPFRDTASRLLDWRSGTGRGRIIEYTNTLGMVRDHWLMGVGAGNWSVAYARYASPEDPSYRPFQVQPTGRLVTGDWLGLVAERGIGTLAALALALFWLARAGWRRFRSAAPDGWIGGVGVLALAAAAVMGVFDVVILRPEPALLLFTTLAVAVPTAPLARQRSWSRPARTLAALGVALVALVFTVRGATQLAALHVAAGPPALDRLERAARIDRGDYRLQIMHAMLAFEARGCGEALAPARRALRLFPPHVVAREIITRCMGGAAR